MFKTIPAFGVLFHLFFAAWSILSISSFLRMATALTSTGREFLDNPSLSCFHYYICIISVYIFYICSVTRLYQEMSGAAPVQAETRPAQRFSWKSFSQLQPGSEPRYLSHFSIILHHFSIILHHSPVGGSFGKHLKGVLLLLKPRFMPTSIWQSVAPRMRTGLRGVRSTA